MPSEMDPEFEPGFIRKWKHAHGSKLEDTEC